MSKASEKKQPFSNSMFHDRELRERFVKGRFAENKYFGNAGIGAWLEGERSAEEPQHDAETVSPWRLFTKNGLLTVADGKERQVLLAYAEPHSAVDAVRHLSETHRMEILPILLALGRSESVSFFRGRFTGPIAVLEPGEAYSVSVGSGDDVRNVVWRRVGSEHVMDVVLDSWRPRGRVAGRARQYLCDSLAEAIVLVQAEAEDDFDSAVAVSSDGLKIVKADEIVVLPSLKDHYPQIAVSANRCRHSKVLRSECLRRNDQRGEKDSESVSRAWYDASSNGGGGFEQLLVFTDSRTVLMTTRRFCPDLLFS